MKFKNGKKRLGLKRGMSVLLVLLLIFGTFNPQIISAYEEENTQAMPEAVDQLTETSDTEDAVDQQTEASDTGDVIFSEDSDAEQVDEAVDDNMDGTTPDYTLIQPFAEEGNDVSDKIYFSDGELTNNSELIDQGEGLEVGYWETYTFKIKWEANPTTPFVSGDYFTFYVPEIFAPQIPIPIISSSSLGENWGTITFADMGDGMYQATAVFNDSVNGLAHLSGYLELSATYKETKDGERIEWIFKFLYGNETDGEYKYEGETGIPPQEIKDKTADIFKGGDFNDDDYLYNWRVIINESNDDWGGDFVKLTDTLGVGHEMAPFPSKTISEPGYFGNDADPADSNMYFRIQVVDWNTMREDFNAKWGAEGTYTKLYKETEDSQYLPQVNVDDSVYEFYQDEDGNIIDIPPGMVTNFMMYEMFGTWIDGIGYKYLHHYDESIDGPIETKLTSDGFEIYFPKGSYADESVFISYNTKLTATTNIDELENTVVVEGEKTIEYTASVSETSGKAGITGEKGHLLLVKADSNENASLAGAEFEFSGNGITTPMTATTNSSGVIDFDFTYIPSYEGTYTLKEITPPDGYSATFEDITIELNSDGEIIAVNGEDVSNLTNGVLE